MQNILYQFPAPWPALPVSYITNKNNSRSLFLTEQEQYFVAVIRALLDDMIAPPMEPIFGRLEEPLQELARELCAAYHHYGLEGFWKSYTAYDEDIPRLQDLRVLLEEVSEYKHGVLLSEGEDQMVQWLWEPRLALGRITTLLGAPGAGKTSLAIDIATRVTGGCMMPDGAPPLCGGVVLIMPEDGLWDTIRPRFARGRADLSKVVSVGRIPTVDPVTGYTYERPFSLPDDIPLLDRAMRRVQARLLIIDSLFPLLALPDQERRVLLAPVQALLHKYQAACILVNSCKEGGHIEGRATFADVARSALMIDSSVSLPEQNRLIHLRTTLGEYAPPLSFRVVDDRHTTGDLHPYVLWGGVQRMSEKSWPFAAETRLRPSSAQRRILALLAAHYPRTLNTSAIAAALPEWSLGHVRTTLFKMVHAGLIAKQARGLFRACER
jgi:hypothetical protein